MRTGSLMVETFSIDNVFFLLFFLEGIWWSFTWQQLTLLFRLIVSELRDSYQRVLDQGQHQSERFLSCQLRRRHVDHVDTRHDDSSQHLQPNRPGPINRRCLHIDLVWTYHRFHPPSLTLLNACLILFCAQVHYFATLNSHKAVRPSAIGIKNGTKKKQSTSFHRLKSFEVINSSSFINRIS